MFQIFWWNNKDHCGSCWVTEINDINAVANALKKKWKVCVMIHTTTKVIPFTGYEEAFIELKKDREEEANQ